MAVATLSCSLLALGVTAAPAQATSCGYVTYADGTVGPTVCKNGDANAKVQAAYAKAAPAIMGLASDATRKQLQAAVCSDHMRNDTSPELYDAIEYQAARYDWRHAKVHRVVHRLVDGKYC